MESVIVYVLLNKMNVSRPLAVLSLAKLSLCTWLHMCSLLKLLFIFAKLFSDKLKGGSHFN